MCLEVNKGRKLHVATKPITCYKAVHLISPHVYESELHRFKYELGKTYFLSIEDKHKSFGSAKAGKTIYVHEGFHSFKRMEDAKILIKECYTTEYALSDPKMVVIKCEIPEGAKYWVGNKGAYYGLMPSDNLDYNLNNYVEFCSEHIKIVAYMQDGKWVTA